MLQIQDGYTCVEYATAGKTAHNPPYAYGWKIHWPQMAKFLEMDEETAICRIKDSDLEYEMTYYKSGLHHVTVINGFDKNRMERIMGCLCRLQTKDEPGKFIFYPRNGMSPALLEAFYPDVAQRARAKLDAELMPISDDGVKTWFFVGHQSHELYTARERIFLWRNGASLLSAASQDGLKVQGEVTRFLNLEALDGTDYQDNAIRDVDGLIHLGIIEKNHDVLETMKKILTEEEFAALQP